MVSLRGKLKENDRSRNRAGKRDRHKESEGQKRRPSKRDIEEAKGQGQKGIPGRVETEMHTQTEVGTKIKRQTRDIES